MAEVGKVVQIKNCGLWVYKKLLSDFFVWKMEKVSEKPWNCGKWKKVIWELRLVWKAKKLENKFYLFFLDRDEAIKRGIIRNLELIEVNR